MVEICQLNTEPGKNGQKNRDYIETTLKDWVG